MLCDVRMMCARVAMCVRVSVCETKRERILDDMGEVGAEEGKKEGTELCDGEVPGEMFTPDGGFSLSENGKLLVHNVHTCVCGVCVCCGAVCMCGVCVCVVVCVVRG